MVPTTYPVGGYVNMNQLAHMALQHQGLCPTADQKPDCEDIGRRGPSHGGRDRWDEAGPRSQQQLTPPHSGNVANIGEYRQTSLSGYTHTHTHVCLTTLCPGLPRKVKTIWILLKQEAVSGSGISWAICKSASCSRQITMPAPHHSVFYRPDALPAAQPTASKH